MARTSAANEDRARRVEQRLAKAKAAGAGSEAYEAALSDPDCVRAIVAEAENLVDWALDETDDHRDLFVFRLARHVEIWRPVFEGDRMTWIADALRGASVLKGMSKTFRSEPWWPG